MPAYNSLTIPQDAALTLGVPASIDVDGGFLDTDISTGTMTLISGTLPPGMAQVGTSSAIRGTPAATGIFFSEWIRKINSTYNIGLTITVTAAIGGTGTGAGGTGTGTGTAAGTNANADLALTWFQARSLALAGAKIRRAGEKDRYFEHVRGFWELQLVNATTGATNGQRTVVEAAKFTVAHFRATDWTVVGTPDPAALALALAITTEFP